MSLDVMRTVLAPNHPIMGVGRHILEELRHLFTNLAPDILLIDMSLTDDSNPMLDHQAESAPTTARVFVLRDYRNHAYVFGLLSSGTAAGLEEHDALQVIADAIQSGRAGTVDGCNHRIVGRLSSQQLAGAPA